jgi:4-amino-4-deoxy-L-arabinose transferase-like glycosyltransferase
VEPIPAVGHAKEPSAFGGPTGLLRLFSLSLGGQDGWYLPFALVGLIAIALTRPRRRDPLLATLLVLGGWFLCEALLLSFSKGIVHPYYVSALGPGAAAMAGIGATVLAGRALQLGWRVVLTVVAAGATVAVQIVLLQREHYLHAFVPVLVVASAAAVLVALLVRRAAGPAIAVLLGLCLIAPTAYASTLWQVPTDGTFPAAGPHASPGLGGIGTSPSTLAADRHLIAYVNAHAPGIRWGVLTIASDTAAPLILMNFPATALAGYSGTDQALSVPGLARWVASGQARYVLLGGAYSTRGGNGATRATRLACQLVPSPVWRHVRIGGVGGLQLYDCRGRAAQLAADG